MSLLVFVAVLFVVSKRALTNQMPGMPVVGKIGLGAFEQSIDALELLGLKEAN
jgi:hypothetical protein